MLHAVSLRRSVPHLAPTLRRFTSVPHLQSHKPLPPRPTINEADITEKFLKGSGPGGQKINKTSSAVQLKHLPTGLVTKCQATRSREQNRTIARRMLAQMLEDLEKGDDSRTAIKAERDRKKKASGSKKRRRKYRALEDARAAGEEAVDEDYDEDDDDSSTQELAQSDDSALEGEDAVKEEEAKTKWRVS